jgi:hypothetical protein
MVSGELSMAVPTGEPRSVTGLVVLSCVVAIYFIGSGLLLLAWPSKAGL